MYNTQSTNNRNSNIGEISQQETLQQQVLPLPTTSQSQGESPTNGNGTITQINESPVEFIYTIRATTELMERHFSERAQQMRANINNVLNNHAQIVNNTSNIIGSWIPGGSNSRSVRLPPASPTPENLQQLTSSTDSYIINLDNHTNNDSNNRIVRGDDLHHGHINRQNTERNSNDMIHQQRHQYQLQQSTHNFQHNQHHNHDQPNIDDARMADALTQIPEARALFNSAIRYLPFICILIVKTCYDHLDGILDFSALLITFMHANWTVRQEIAKQTQRNIFPLLRELVYIILVIIIIGFILEKRNIFISVLFAGSLSDPFTLRNLLFSVAITDLILKLLTVGVKICITILPARIVEMKGRGRIFLLTESVSQLYRALAPIQPWLYYLLESYTGKEKLVGVAFSAAYMVAKGSDLLQRAQFVKRAVIESFKKVRFGATPSKEQLQSAGSHCPICHDTYANPVLLECQHIFCELCVGTWFDREQTCPLCRAKVADDPSWRDGATTYFVQLY